METSGLPAGHVCSLGAALISLSTFNNLIFQGFGTGTFIPIFSGHQQIPLLMVTVPLWVEGAVRSGGHV